MAVTENVGLVLVHGIGEERRFEHLDENTRPLIEVLRRQYPDAVTVEIAPAQADANLADQPNWGAGQGASLRVIVKRPGTETRIHVHEVWWADVNEPSSLTKQFRFWRWGLTVWNLPKKMASSQPLAQSQMFAIDPAPGTQGAARWKIFGVSSFFLTFSVTIGLFFGLLKRVFDVDPPDLVTTFINYLSSIKIYSQRQRWGASAGENADFLDTMGEPPRVSIRRRMVRTIADVACAGYDRWYILAHSLGSVVAFNGLMEPACVFPNYLDEARWARLKALGFGGEIAGGGPPPAGSVTPARPAWLAPNDVAYRAKIFSALRGFVTYGSPIGKFSAIWPARVPICREPAFGAGTPWINVYDPLDPVSGPTEAFDADVSPVVDGLQCWPRKHDVGYAASDVLLLGHIKYLEPGDLDRKGAAPDTLAARMAGWLVTGLFDPDTLPRTGTKFYRDSDKGLIRRRTGALVFQWLAAYGLVSLAFAFLWLNAVYALMGKIGLGHPDALAFGLPHFGRAAWLTTIGGWLWGSVVRVSDWVAHQWLALIVILFAPPAITWLLGLAAKWIFFRQDFEPDDDAIDGEPVRPAARVRRLALPGGRESILTVEPVVAVEPVHLSRGRLTEFGEDHMRPVIGPKT